MTNFEDLKTKAKSLHIGGNTNDQIADLVGLPVQLINEWSEDYGIDNTVEKSLADAVKTFKCKEDIKPALEFVILCQLYSIATTSSELILSDDTLVKNMNKQADTLCKIYNNVFNSNSNTLNVNTIVTASDGFATLLMD